MTTEKGEGHLDGISSWWVNLHGHAHPYIARAIATQAHQLEHVIFADYSHPPAITLAQRLLGHLHAGLTRIFYSDNGSTAVEVAVKMALQYWHNQGVPKRKIVALKGAYHGDTFGAMAVSGKCSYHAPFWPYLFPVESIDPSPEALLPHLEKGDVACFVFEPLLQGAGGMRLYSADTLKEMMRLCKEFETLTVSDEVMTGFGRTGPLFATPEPPDLIALSKGITGGFLPLGATACREEIYAAFLSDERGKALLHGHSYTGNPLACAAALANLDLLEEPQCTQRRSTIAQQHQAFCAKWTGHPELIRIETLGTVLILEYRTWTREQLLAYFRKRRMLLRPLGQVLYVMPPYCIGVDLEKIYAAIEETLC